MASDLKVGKTIALVAGTLANCATDGAGSCFVDGTSYKAAQLSNFTALDVKTGVSVAGVAGSATLEGHINCAADAATSCVTTASYPAANATNAVAGNIKSGVTIAGITGQYPSATFPLPGALGGTADLASGTFNTQIKSATAFEYWNSAGTRYTGNGDANITAAKIVSGTTIFGTAGSATVESHTACAADGASSCYTDGTAYKAAKLSNFTAADVKSGVTIAGVAGQYPSPTYALAGANSTADLTLATFDAKIKSATAFEWFDGNGTRYTASGDADITAANIAKDISIFGTVGTYVALPPGACGGAGDGCYDDAAAIAAGAATTPLGKSVVYVATGSGAYVWKDASSNKVLRPNGLDAWAMKLNLNGKGLQAAGNEFVDYSIIEGRKCPTNVYIDDANKVSAGNCLYYSMGMGEQSLDAAGTSQTTANTLGMSNWSGYNSGQARWYVGNVKTCSDKGMRLPTLFETAIPTPSSTYLPTDASPTFAGTTNGIPSNVGGSSDHTWTASSYTFANSMFWQWYGNTVTNDGYGCSVGCYVRCVLP